MLRRLGTITVVVAGLLAAPAYAEVGQIAPLDRATPVSAYGDTAVWSTFDPTINAYRLTISSDGRTFFPQVDPRSGQPFDADVGPGPVGISVVYSRCEGQTALLQGDLLPTWDLNTGCRLYEYRLGSEGERQIQTVRSRGASDVQPAVWGNRVAFVRLGPGRRGPYHPRLLSQSLTADRHLHRFRGGYPQRAPGRPLVTGLDLRGTTLAFSWKSASRSGQSPRAQIWLESSRGKRTLVAIDDDDPYDGRYYGPPALTAGAVNFAVTQVGIEAPSYVSLGLRTSQPRSAVSLPVGAVAAAPWAGGAIAATPRSISVVTP